MADLPMPLSPMTTTLKGVSRLGMPGAPSTRRALAPAGSGGGELQHDMCSRLYNQIERDRSSLR